MQRGCVRGGLYHLHSTTTTEYLDIQPFLVQAQALALEALKYNKRRYEQNVTLICLVKCTPTTLKKDIVLTGQFQIIKKIHT